MSSHDYSRSVQRHTAPLAAESAFGLEVHPRRSSSRSPSRRSSKKISAATSGAPAGTHYMAGDTSKIFNPATGKYVKIDGKVGQEVLNTYGYPQEGGFSFADMNDQLTKSFSDLYNNLKSTWDSLLSSSGYRTASTATARKSSSRKVPLAPGVTEEPLSDLSFAAAEEAAYGRPMGKPYKPRKQRQTKAGLQPRF